MTASGIVALSIADKQRAPEVVFVVVPDFARDGMKSENSQTWIDSMMPPDGAQAQIIRFEYQIDLSGRSIWHQLSSKGEDLFQILSRHVAKYQLREKPVIVIGYGLGGLIVKRALSLLSDGTMLADPTVQAQSKEFLDAIAGVLFFGTPHTRMKEDARWHKLTHLLHFAARLPKRFLAHSEAEANVAAIICEEFERCGLESTVLSIYETQPTKIRSPRWLLKDTVMLVDKHLAETWSKKEKLLGNNASHQEVGDFIAGSVIHQEIGLLLMSALSMRKAGFITGATKDLKFAEQLGLWEPSISQASVHLKAPKHAFSGRSDSRRHDSSEDAILGSSLPSHFDVVPSNDQGEYVADEPESTTWPCHLWSGFQDSRDFWGREDTLKSIDEVFFDKKEPEANEVPMGINTATCCCISGLGGIGKTRMAIQYASSRKDRFDAIFVVQAENSAKLSETFGKIAMALGLDDASIKTEKPSEEADLIVNRNRVMKWLSFPKFSAATLDRRAKVLGEASKKDPRWLIVFDNVENSSILKDYWPVEDSGCILVTTRDARNNNYLRSHSHIYLDRLSATPASQLLLQLSYMSMNESNKDVARTIVDKLGGVPIAIEHVAAYIHGKGMTLQEFLALYNETLLQRQKSKSYSGSWTYKLATVWATQTLSASANSLIGVYAFMDPDGIDDSILVNRTSVPQLENYPPDGLSHIDARGELLRSSLIRIDTNQSPVVIRIHRLVQDIVLSDMTNEHRLVVFSFVVLQIYGTWPFSENNWNHENEQWATQAALLPNIIRLADIAGTCDITSLELDIKRKFVMLLSRGGWYRQERGDYDTGIPLAELGIGICASSPPDFFDLRAELAFVMGNAMSETNRWNEYLSQAQEQLQYRLLYDSANKIPASSDTAIAYSELGLAQTLLRQYDAAVSNCDKALELYATQSDVLDGSFMPAFPHFHRAQALVGAGRPGAGEEGLLRLVRWHETRFGPEHTEFKLGYAWQCLGLIYARIGCPTKSMEAYQKSYVNYKATVGPLYHRYGNVCSKIAEHHASLQQFEAADFFFNEAETSYKSASHFKPELARHYFIQSRALLERGDEEASKQKLEQAQKLYDTIVPHTERVPLSHEVLTELVATWGW